MKVVILAGGLGSRMDERSKIQSKALSDIGGHPILWHLLNYYFHFGFDEFVIALGHMANSVRNYFEWAGYSSSASEVDGTSQQWHNSKIKVNLVDTGLHTENGGRIKRLAKFLDNGTFMLTWCDGLSDVNLNCLLDFHKSHGLLATLTAVHPPGRFGRLVLLGNRVTQFNEKTISSEEWINGAFHA